MDDERLLFVMRQMELELQKEKIVRIVMMFLFLLHFYLPSMNVAHIRTIFHVCVT